MENQYEIIMEDGVSEPVRVTMGRNELSQMIGNSVAQGVMASAAIEGEETDVPDMELLNHLIFDLPDSLLVTE